MDLGGGGDKEAFAFPADAASHGYAITFWMKSKHFIGWKWACFCVAQAGSDVKCPLLV